MKLNIIKAKIKLGINLTKKEMAYYIIHSKDLNLNILKQYRNQISKKQNEKEYSL